MAPDRVRVQHGAGTARADDLEVQERLGRHPRPGRGRPERRRRIDRRATVVHLQNLIRVQLTLESRTRRNRQPQRIPTDDDAEIPAGAHDPAALVEATADPDQLLEYLRLSVLNRRQGLIIALCSSQRAAPVNRRMRRNVLS